MSSGSFAPDLASARRRLLLESAGLAVSTGGFGFVYGLAAHNAGFSLVEAVAMSLLPFAGASQFAAVGYVAQGLPWISIVLLTAVLNSRHLLYSAALAPRLRRIPVLQRAAMAQVLTDEAFALSAGHFQRLGRIDVRGYWIAAIVAVWLPFNVGTLVGAIAGGAVPDPSRYGLGVVFPAAMAGLAVGLVTGRREFVAAGGGVIIGVSCSLVFGPGVGIMAGGLLAPLLALAVPAGGNHRSPDSDVAGVRVDLAEALSDLDSLGPQDGPAESAT
jgi:4-azaleucine resistance transporter AzlC